LTGTLSRRLFCLTTLAAHVAAASAASLDNPIAAIETEHGGRLGAFARDTETSRVTAYRADERFLLESTFKGPLAAMLLAHVDAGTETLDSLVSYGPHELAAGRAPLVLAASYEKADLPDGDGEAVLRAVGAAVVSSWAQPGIGGSSP